MKNITKIVKLKGCATFRDFNWPEELQEFRKYNLLYGWNGSGKTTISNIFRSLEKQQSPNASEVQMVFGGELVKSSNFSDFSDPQIRVFNRDFIRENIVFDEANLPPVFVLGKENIEDQGNLESAQAELAEVRRNLPTIRDNAKRLSDDFKNFQTEQARAIKDALFSSGIKFYRDYDKRNFVDRVGDLLKNERAQATALTDQKRRELTDQINQKPLEPLAKIPEWSDLPMSFLNRVESLLGESVVARVLEELRNKPILADWVEKGLKLHEEGDRSTCKFCGQVMPVARITELEGHFNDAVDNLKSRISQLVKIVKQAKDSVSRNPYPEIRLYPNFQREYLEAVGSLLGESQAILSDFDLLIQILMRKEANPFEPIEFSGLISRNLVSIHKINTIIQAHNDQTNKLSEQKLKACEELERSYVSAKLKEFQKKESLSEEADKRKVEANDREKNLVSLIKDIKKRLHEHRTSAEGLNKDLKGYLGHDELQLDVHETGYRITRSSEIATHLSEGERTAIALLYFLKSLEASSLELKNSIVVLDDPVSSLDERALFSAFSFIQNRTDQVGQIFILTHNFVFFRLVKRWMSGKIKNKWKTNEEKKYSFYMVNCRVANATRFSTIAQLDPLLENYESDYQFIFSKVYEAVHEPINTSLESNYHMPNMSRRLLESFLSFRYPQIKENFMELLKATKYEPQKLQKIYSFCHKFSHADRIPGTEHDPNILSETRDVLADILDLMRTTDQGHFEGLVALCPKR